MVLTGTLQSNKELAQQWLDYISSGDIDSSSRITSADWVMHGIPLRIPKGPAGIRALFESFGSIQQRWVVNQLIAEADKVVIFATNYCMQENFLGIASHGKEQVFTAIFIHRVNNGEICETWRNADDLGRVMQLGARIIPAKQEADLRENEIFSRAINVLKEARG
jgi:hypothetical protein